MTYADWNQPPPQPYPYPSQEPVKKGLSTTVKVLIAGAVLAGIAVIALVLGTGAGHAHGPQAYLEKLQSERFYNRAGDSAALGRGYDVCEALQAGSSHASVVHTIYLDNNFTEADAEDFVNITEDYLCP